MTHPRHSLSAAAVLAAIGLAAPATGQGAALFSEYVEGSGSNKALEIFNGAAQSLDLTGYEVRVFANGAVNATGVLALSGRSIPAGGTFVVAHPLAAPDLLALADLTSGVLNYNGDDAIALFAQGVAVDSIGQVGVDPGDAWTSAGVSTRDQTLRRSAAITFGDANLADIFDPALEWQRFPIDTLDGLGTHSAPPPSVPLPPSLLLLASATGGLALIRRGRRVQAGGRPQPA
jgi:hypothetical protein